MPTIEPVHFRARLFPPSDSMRTRALALALDTARGASDSGVERFIEDADRRGLNIEVLSGVCRDGDVVFSCLLVESAGRAALLVVPWSRFSDVDSKTAEEVIRLALDGALVRGNALIQTLVPYSTPELVSHLPRIGFRKLTQLIYLRRRVALAPSESATDLEWVQYSPDKETLFARALQESYGESLDCPELCGLRTNDEVLAGHRATGDFDPSRWFVACRRGNPVGILLLSLLPPTESIEVVYMGVAQTARGTGVSDALLHRAVQTACTAQAKFLALAVDSRNDPARRLYDRWRFVELTRRDAWIATSSVA